MFSQTRLTQLLGIEKPIISGGMIWCSGYKLAAAVSNAGGLGLIGCGSMHPEVFRQHIQKCKQATNKPFGVNISLLYPQVDEVINIALDEQVPIIVTSAGNPSLWTSKLKEAGCKVLHVVSSTKFAKKAEAAGVDAVIAEGYEAGGHNGRDETSTLALIQGVTQEVKCPVVAAGGFGTGRSILAALALGAEGVQIGTLFALSQESSAHDNFKKVCTEATEGQTTIILKPLVPTRLIANDFAKRALECELQGGTKEELTELLGKGRAKMGIFEGNLSEGELEIGQICSIVNTVKPVAEIIQALEEDYSKACERIANLTKCAAK